MKKLTLHGGVNLLMDIRYGYARCGRQEEPFHAVCSPFPLSENEGSLKAFNYCLKLNFSDGGTGIGNVATARHGQPKFTSAGARCDVDRNPALHFLH